MKSRSTTDEHIAGMLSAHPLFAPLEPATLLRIAAGARARDYDKDEVLIQEGDKPEWLWVLVKGTVAAYVAGADVGEDVLLRLFAAPSCFGDLEILTDAPQLVRVEATEPCQVVVVSRVTFQTVLRGELDAAWGIANNLARQLAIATYHEKALAFHSVEERLAATLLSFLQAYGEKLADGRVRLKHKTTTESLSRCIGSTRRSVERAFAKWQEEGWLQWEQGIYVFRSKDDLRQRTDPARLLLYSRLDARARAAGEKTLNRP